MTTSIAAARPRLRARYTIHLLSLSLVAALAGCPADPANEPNEYQGCATDENWQTLDDMPRTATDGGQAPVAVAPLADGAMFTFAARPTFKWQVSANVVGSANGTASCPKCTSCGTPGPLHEPAVSGDVYDLRFTIDGALAHRVLTTQQTWTPADATWSSWRGKTVSLVITRVVLKANDISEGPYAAARPIGFTVGG